MTLEEALRVSRVCATLDKRVVITSFPAAALQVYGGIIICYHSNNNRIFAKYQRKETGDYGLPEHITKKEQVILLGETGGWEPYNLGEDW